MKKILMVAFAVVLLCTFSIAGVAEPAVYECDVYSIEFPEGYVIADSDLLAEYLAAAQADIGEKSDDESAPVLDNIIVASTEDGQSSVNVLYTPSYDEQTAMEMMTGAVAAMEEQLSTTFSVPEVIVSGDNEFAGISYSLYGMEFAQYCLKNDANVLYISFTNVDAAEALSILATLQIM